MIRKAIPADVSRIAEILVFVKRVKFRPIFQDDDYSFGELQVLPVAQQYGKPEILEHILVYDDGGIVKGLVRIEGNEIVELYVDYFFWNQGIGSALIEHAKAHYPVTFLWAIEKNTDAICFYERHGFHLTETKKFEEGTTVYDALADLCKANKIHMESKYETVYQSYYVEGIGHLYEFDAGKQSGWLYTVNGKQPEYGAGKVELQDGDHVIWYYVTDYTEEE